MDKLKSGDTVVSLAKKYEMNESIVFKKCEKMKWQYDAVLRKVPLFPIKRVLLRVMVEKTEKSFKYLDWKPDVKKSSFQFYNYTLYLKLYTKHIIKIKNCMKIKPNLRFYIALWFRYPRNFAGTLPPRITRDYCIFFWYFL